PRTAHARRRRRGQRGGTAGEGLGRERRPVHQRGPHHHVHPARQTRPATGHPDRHRGRLPHGDDRTMRPKWTIRARLTLTYSVLMVVVASLMVVAVYLFMSYGPSYDFPMLTPVPGNPTETTTTIATGVPVEAGPIVIRSKADVLTTLLISSLVALVVIAGLA